jgi:membrane associated rhomboid family serine protease
MGGVPTIPFIMSFYERPYSRRPYSSAMISAWSVTAWLIAINVAVFILDMITHRDLANLGYFSAATAIGGLQIWRFVTFQFLHLNVGHIFFNMLALYFFGPMVEQYLGKRRYLAFYLLCGVAGAASYLILLMLHVLPDGPATPLLGASAGIFGVLIAAATRVAPNATVMLLLPPIPMKLRTLAWVMLGIALYTVLFSGHNAGGEAAHLGGAALGFILIQRPQLLNIFQGRLR